MVGFVMVSIWIVGLSMVWFRKVVLFKMVGLRLVMFMDIPMGFRVVWLGVML